MFTHSQMEIIFLDKSIILFNINSAYCILFFVFFFCDSKEAAIAKPENVSPRCGASGCTRHPCPAVAAVALPPFSAPLLLRYSWSAGSENATRRDATHLLPNYFAHGSVKNSAALASLPPPPPGAIIVPLRVRESSYLLISLFLLASPSRKYAATCHLVFAGQTRRRQVEFRRSTEEFAQEGKRNFSSEKFHSRYLYSSPRIYIFIYTYMYMYELISIFQDI